MASQWWPPLYKLQQQVLWNPLHKSFSFVFIGIWSKLIRFTVNLFHLDWWKQIWIYSFLAHLSRRLKWAFLIKICPLSVVVVVVVAVVVVVVVNFSHFHLLLQNHWANFNQTWHKASLGEGDSSLFKWRAPPFPKGR